MKTVLYLTLLLTIPQWLLSATVSGTVVDDKNNEPIFGANLLIVGSDIGTTTDFDGNFTLNLEDDNYQLRISYIGFKTKTIDLDLTQGNINDLVIKLGSAMEQIGVVTVTGGKYEKEFSEEIVSMEVIKLNTIENNNANMVESLNKIPGINMIGENISIRGGSGFAAGTANRTMMLLDGMPILGADNGGINWNSMPMEIIEQVEILKGSSSALYGSSALNGVINLITKNPKKEPYAKVIMYTGFYQKPNPMVDSMEYHQWWSDSNHTPLFFGASGTFLKKFRHVDWGINASYKQDDHYLYGADYKRFSLFNELRHNFKKLSGLTVGLNNNFYYQKGNSFFIYDDWDGDGSNAYLPRAKQGLLNWSFNFNPYATYYDKQNNRHHLSLRYYQTYSSNLLDTADAQFEESNSSITYGEYTFQREFEKLGINLTSGVSAYISSVRSAHLNNHKGQNVAAFVQLEKSFFDDRLTLSCGARMEYYAVDTLRPNRDLSIINRITGDTATSPIVPVFRLGANYQVSAGTYLRSSFGQGYRFPSIAELYTEAFRNGIQTIPNPELKAESGWGGEIGIKQMVKVSEWVGYFDLSVFANQYTNMIEFKPVGIPGGIGAQAQNVENARIRGIEFSGFAQGKIFEVPLNFLIGYTYLDPANLDSIEEQSIFNFRRQAILNYRMRHSAKVDIEASYKDFLFGISGFYNSYMERVDLGFLIFAQGLRAYRETKEASSLRGDIVFDTRLGYTFLEKYRSTLIIKNIFNTDYTLRPAYLEAPRNYTLQFRYIF